MNAPTRHDRLRRSSRRRFQALPVAGQRQAVPGAPHLLRRPQLCRARDRDGARPDQGAAVLLPEEPRQPRDATASSPIRARHRTCITRSRWWWRSARAARTFPSKQALDHVFGYGVGLDMTRRDLQGEAKKLGRPWEVGKAFEASAPCAPLVPASEIGHPASGAVWLKVNGEVRQQGDLNQMIWKVPEMIAYLSGLFTPAARRHHHDRHARRRRRGRARRRARRRRRGRRQARGRRRLS